MATKSGHVKAFLYCFLLVYYMNGQYYEGYIQFSQLKLHYLHLLFLYSLYLVNSIMEKKTYPLYYKLSDN